MNKKLYCIFLSLILILTSYLTVQAAGATASLKPSSSTVKPGGDFSVILSVNCADGINGMAGLKCNYDSSKLELVESGINDSNFEKIENDFMSNSEQKITSSNIYILKFKVIESVKDGEKLTISTNSFTIDSDLETNSEITIEPLSTTITIATNNSNESNVTEEPTAPTNTENPSVQDKKIETPSTNNKINTKDNDNTKTKSTSLPKTGLKTLVPLIIIIAVVGIVFVARSKSIKLK